MVDTSTFNDSFKLPPRQYLPKGYIISLYHPIQQLQSFMRLLMRRIHIITNITSNYFGFKKFVIILDSNLFPEQPNWTLSPCGENLQENSIFNEKPAVGNQLDTMDAGFKGLASRFPRDATGL